MTIRDPVKKVAQSLVHFMNRHVYLVQHDVSERAITHKLAEAFQSVFGETNAYDVDCEYNRVELNQIKRGNNERRVYPDLVVHHRQSRNDNLLAVEVKKSKAGKKAIRKDEKKLEEYVRGHLIYKYGLSVVFRVGKKPRCKCRLFDGKRWTEPPTLCIESMERHL